MINESVQGIIKQETWGPRDYHLVYHDHLVELFQEDTLLEGENDELTPELLAERDKVLALIKTNKWDRDALHFFRSMRGSKHSKMLTPYTVDELRDMDTFKVPGYKIGFALKDHEGEGEGKSGHSGRVEIVAVHNNSGIPGLGKALMRAAMAKGGTVLDHFDGYLTNFYSGLGFEEYRRDKYDPRYDKGGAFAKKYGKQDVIYRRLKKPEEQEK